LQGDQCDLGFNVNPNVGVCLNDLGFGGSCGAMCTARGYVSGSKTADERCSCWLGVGSTTTLATLTTMIYTTTPLTTVVIETTLVWTCADEINDHYCKSDANPCGWYSDCIADPGYGTCPPGTLCCADDPAQNSPESCKSGAFP